MGNILDVRNYIAKVADEVLGPIGVIKIYKDSESLRHMKTLKNNICVIHVEDTEFDANQGAGAADYITPYNFVWIKKKEVSSLNVTGSQNTEFLDSFITAIADGIESSAGNANDHPYSGVPLLMGYGIGNELDPLGLPGSEEHNWKGMLILWAKIHIKHRRIFNCN